MGKQQSKETNEQKSLGSKTKNLQTKVSSCSGCKTISQSSIFYVRLQSEDEIKNMKK